MAQENKAEPLWRHGTSLFGSLKYGPEFDHFEYVNPKAPKGGTARQLALGTFDNFNPVVSGVKGSVALGLGDLFETLMTPARDEVASEYGLIAESVSYPADFST